MQEREVVQRNLALQRQWYGEQLGDRVRRLVVAYRTSQAQLAEVLGISAPMLSQVMSGRRAKIGNPSVLARLVMLERKVFTPGVAAGESEAMQQALEDVRDSRPALGRDSMPVRQVGNSEEVVRPALLQIAQPHELEWAADLLDGYHPALAGLLRRAASGEPRAEDSSSA
ncbi:XRE family transcriptional regulator [Actinopolyspora sp. H202]|uniref:XRE family transcriptional regulator n=1 Tax=Actinopolyspora sp. H202 TaxID=1500456 RepID=UPI003EE7337E